MPAASSASLSGLLRPAAVKPLSRALNRSFDLAACLFSSSVGSPVSTRYARHQDVDVSGDQTDKLAINFGLVNDMDSYVDDDDDFYPSDENDENSPPSFSCARFSPFSPQQETGADADSFEPECSTFLEPLCGQEQEQEKIKELEHIPRFALPPRSRVSPGTSSFLLLNLRKDIVDLDQVRSKSRSNQ